MNADETRNIENKETIGGNRKFEIFFLFKKYKYFLFLEFLNSFE